MMFSSGVAYSLGMGEIEVGTALNEPLNAKIKLFSATDDELGSLKVDLAPQEAFVRMGIERLPMLRDLRFEIVSEGAGAPYIKVSSAVAVKEPFLDFILTLSWDNGQMLREYTLLLDPPVFDTGEKSGKISVAATQPAQVIRERGPVTSAPGSYGPTGRTDTLWTVAQQMRPNNSITIPQMMIALLKENPEAFENGNINNLKAGYVLRAPEMDVITSLSSPQAAAEANTQYQEWLADRGQGRATSARQRVAAPVTPAAETTTVPPASVAAKPQAEARLQLLTPDQEELIRSGVGADVSGSNEAALRNELAIAMESAETTRQENAELRTRLEELEKQLQTIQKLLTLKDDTLGSLQADQLQKEAEAVVAPVTETPATEIAAQSEPQAQPAVAEASKPKPAPEVREPIPEVSFVDELLANPTMMAAAGGGVIALLVAGLLLARRRRTNQEEEEFPMPTTANEGMSAAPVAGAAAMAGAAAAEHDYTDQGAGAGEVSIGDFSGGMGAIHAEESEIDPIAEADVYLAYRRYEQAEALMKEAIAADPNRAELKLKLLEIYYTTKDKDSFEAQAEALYAGMGGKDDEIWQQAVEMGHEMSPDHPLFAVEDGGISESAEAADEFDTEIDDLMDQGNDLSGESVSGLDDNEFNFDDIQPEMEADTDLGSDFSEELSEIGELSDNEFNLGSDQTGDLDELDLSLDEDLGIGGSDSQSFDQMAGLEDFDLGDEGLEAIGESKSAEGIEDDLNDFSGLDALEAKPSESDGFPTELDEGFDDALQSNDGLGELAQSHVEQALDNEFDLDLSVDADQLTGDLDTSFSDQDLAGALDDGLDLTALESSADSLAEFGGEESSDASLLSDDDFALDLSDELDTNLDGLNESGGTKEKAEKGELSLADHGAHLDDAENHFANPDLDSFSTGASESWGVEAAHSVFHARDVTSEMEKIGTGEKAQQVTPKSAEVVDLAGASANESSVDEDDPLADLADLGDMDFGDMADEDSDLFDSSDDMIGTKLDLAKAYMEMGDQDGARSILGEVVEEGNDNQREEAQELMRQIS